MTGGRMISVAAVFGFVRVLSLLKIKKYSMVTCKSKYARLIPCRSPSGVNSSDTGSENSEPLSAGRIGKSFPESVLSSAFLYLWILCFRHESSGACIELLPENPAFEPIIVPPGSEDFCIEGIGVGLIRQHGSRR